MGSPITNWDGATAYFTGFGSSTPGIILLIAIAAVVGAIFVGHLHESHAYSKVK